MYFVAFVQWKNKIETESLSYYFCMHIKKYIRLESRFYLATTFQALIRSFYALQAKRFSIELCRSTV